MRYEICKASNVLLDSENISGFTNASRRTKRGADDVSKTETKLGANRFFSCSSHTLVRESVLVARMKHTNMFSAYSCPDSHINRLKPNESKVF